MPTPAYQCAIRRFFGMYVTPRRFCKSTLADWQASLTPEMLKPEIEKTQAIMVVYCEGEVIR